MNRKFSRLATIIIFVLGIGGTISLGSLLITRYLQTKEIQQTQQADDLLGQKKYALALAAYEQLLANNATQSDRFWVNQGTALLGLQRYHDALKSCDQATELNLKADFAWNCRGEALYHLGRYDTALAAFQQAIALNARNPTYWLNQNQILIDLAQHKQAITASQEAIALLESQLQSANNKLHLAIAWRRLGQSQLALEKNQPALTAFNQALTYQPNDLTTHEGIGVALYRLGRYEEAVTTFTQILQRDHLTKEQQAINWLYQGISLCETPQASAATEAFEQVKQLTKKNQLQKIAQAGCGIR